MIDRQQPDQSASPGASSGDINWVIRPFSLADIPDIVALENTVDERYNLAEGTSKEDMRLQLSRPHFDAARQVIVVEGSGLPGMPAGALAGSGRVGYEENGQENERIYFPTVVVHPAAEGCGLEMVIAARLLGIVNALQADPHMKPAAKVRVKTFVREELLPLREMWQAVGMREVRQFWVMCRPLDEPVDEPQVVEGVNVRNYRRPDANVAAREAFENSFSDHWDHSPSSQEEWDHWSGSPNMQPDLSWLAEEKTAPGKIAGFCICTIFEQQNKRRSCREGWIDLLGTTREWRRKGLGRALLLHGLLSLRSAGMETALLGVDSESLTGANRLYESVGFRIRSREVSYQCALDVLKL